MLHQSISIQAQNIEICIDAVASMTIVSHISLGDESVCLITVFIDGLVETKESRCAIGELHDVLRIAQNADIPLIPIGMT